MGTSELEKKILDAALHLFIKKGIKSTEVDDIAVSAGISRKAILTYFANKEQILECCVSGEMEKFRQVMQTVKTNSQPAAEKLNEIYRYAFQLAPVFHPIFMFTLQKYYPAVNTTCLLFEEEMFMQHIAQIVAAGTANGELKNTADPYLTVRLQRFCFIALFQQHNKLIIEFGKEKVLESFCAQLVAPIKN